MNPSALVACSTMVVFYSSTLAADIDVKILGSLVTSRSDPVYVHLSTDKELAKFGLTLEDLRVRYKARNFLSAIFYKGPVTCHEAGSAFATPNQYEDFGLKPVRTAVRFVGGAVVESALRPEVVATKRCDNRRASVPLTCRFALSAKRSNSAALSWTTKMGVTGETSIRVGVENVFSFGGRIEVSSGIESGNETTEPAELGTELSGETVVNAGQTVVAHLTSQVGKMRVKLDYEAAPAGHFFTCYRSDGSSALSWHDVADASDKTISGTQELDVTIYSKAEITVEDEGTGKPVSFT